MPERGVRAAWRRKQVVNSNSVMIALLAPVITAAIGALGVWFREWRDQRHNDVRRRHSLEEAQAYVSFLSQWFTARQTVRPDAQIDETRQWAADSLDSVLRTLNSSISEQQPVIERPGAWSRLRKAALLIPLRSWQASLVRLAFYLMIFIASGVAPKLLLDKTKGWGDRVGSTASFLVFTGAILYGLWRLANHLSVRRAALRSGGDPRSAA